MTDLILINDDFRRRITSIRDLFTGHDGAEIRCLYTGNLVRKLALTGDVLDLDAITDQCAVSASAELRYEAWFMDRGSIVVPSLDHGGVKLCTEGDFICFEDGTRAQIIAE